MAPVSRDSGTVSGNHRQPRRYHRRLRHILWMAAFTAARECPISRAYYEKKRAEGKNRRQAILALARRRVDVLWALIRDRKTFSRPAVTRPRRSLKKLALRRRDPIAPAASPCPPRSTGVTWRLELWSWAGTTAVRGTWVNAGHSLLPQANPQVARLGPRALVAQGIEHRFPKTTLYL
ncbi:transposase [Micromonospora sp. WMMD980]|uniref:transposase n=1 Tax=Micromonospora sp. WMMD980 TaxID=3016088 RepID=UPI002416ECA9|nr:transposase [Micromonospora sp. WMMD980]MDG4803253.1 transposase [Micromonospora sp. WMMD980]